MADGEAKQAQGTTVDGAAALLTSELQRDGMEPQRAEGLVAMLRCAYLDQRASPHDLGGSEQSSQTHYWHGVRDVLCRLAQGSTVELFETRLYEEAT